MIDYIVQNEINRQFREFTSYAMIESLNRKKEKLNSELIVTQNDLFVPQCTIMKADNGATLLICSLIISVFIK